MPKLSEYYKGNIDWLEDGTIFCTVAGSHAYGTNIATSDLDMRGICIPPMEYFLGFAKKFEQVIQNDPVDLVIYSLPKFMKLAGDCNPNIIEILFTDRNKEIFSTPIFEKLYANRALFLSTKARHTFAGYAFAQLKRIKSHREWLLNPPSHKPTREEFGLNDAHKINKSVMGAFDNLAEKHKTSFDGEIMKLLSAEKRYTTALTQYNQYMSWKENRNPSRAFQEAEYGYDCKHGMHLVRLMKMCKEILTTGEVIVNRPDADELLAIRNGDWTYDQLISWAENQENELDSFYKSGKSPLPHKPNVNKLHELCVELVREHHKNG